MHSAVLPVVNLFVCPLESDMGTTFYPHPQHAPQNFSSSPPHPSNRPIHRCTKTIIAFSSNFLLPTVKCSYKCLQFQSIDQKKIVKSISIQNKNAYRASLTNKRTDSFDLMLCEQCFFISNQIESNIGLLFEILNQIEQFLPFSKVGMLNSFLQRVSIACYAERCISYDRFCPTV